MSAASTAAPTRCAARSSTWSTAEAASYTWIGFGPADKPADKEDGAAPPGGLLPAVHLAVAKQKGSNAVDVANRIEQRVAELAPALFPAGVHARITRDYGQTANDKVNELLEALAVALVIVIALIAYTLGWREGLIVATAVPITFALTLMVNYWAGYTINRVTLFALILSLGLVVDDPVVDIENIYRHMRMRREPPLQAIRTAVNEVRPPILLATLAVIVSFLPMYLITGMMGPYMSPMALNVPVAMLMSMAVAFMVTPWLSYRVLRGHVGHDADAAPPPPLQESWTYRTYATLLGPFLRRGLWFWSFILAVVALFAFAAALPAMRLVPLKLLPFDNKSELQILVNPPEGTTLERTEAILRRLTDVLRAAPEVKDFETFAGIASPMDFNGMVRHYYLRRPPPPRERGSPSSRSRPARRCWRRSPPSSTGRPTRPTSRSARAPAWSRRGWRRNRGSATSTPRWRTTATGWSSSPTRRRRPCPASRPRTSPRRCSSRSPASTPPGCTCPARSTRSRSSCACRGRRARASSRSWASP